MGITDQRTRTRKWSNDRMFEAKKDWVLAAARAAEAGTLDGVVVSFDECGPIFLMAQAGSGIGPEQLPRPAVAVVGRPLAGRAAGSGPDVGADRLWGHVEGRRVTGGVVLEFLRDIRRRYPAEVTVYIVKDKPLGRLDAHIRRWTVNNNVGLLPTPTDASQPDRVPLLGLR